MRCAYCNLKIYPDKAIVLKEIIGRDIDNEYENVVIFCSIKHLYRWLQKYRGDEI